MNARTMLLFIAAIALAYTIGVVHATTSIATQTALATQAARDASAAVVPPAMIGAISLTLAIVDAIVR